MSTAFGVDLDRCGAERTYRSLGPDGRRLPRRGDDATAGGRPRRAGSPGTCPSGIWADGRTARPGRTPNICNGGAWVWDDSAAVPVGAGLPGRVLGSAAATPARSGTCATSSGPTASTSRSLEPLTTLRRRRTADPGGLEVDLDFEAIMAPNPHPTGVVPFFKGAHFDQAGHVTGTMVLHGEEIPIDCYSVRDRSWGPRPLGRPKPPDAAGGKRRAGKSVAAGTFGGVGYSFCAAGPGEAWLIYAIPGPEVEPVSCGFLLRGGEYGHILAGERRVTFDAETGWPLTIRDRGGGRVRPSADRAGRRGEPALARPRRRLAGPLALGRRGRGLRRGPELLQPGPVGGQPARRSTCS